MIATKEKTITIKRLVYITTDGEEFESEYNAYRHEEELIAKEGIFLDRYFKPVELVDEITAASYVFLPTQNIVDRFRDLMEWGGDTTEGLTSPGWYRFESDHHDYWLNLSEVATKLLDAAFFDGISKL